MLGRIDIEADDIPQLGGKLRVVRQLEGAHPVRLEAVRRPDLLYAAVADAGGFRHRPAGPVRPLAGRFGQRHLDHRLESLPSAVVCRPGGWLCSKPSTPSAMKATAGCR